MDLTIRSLSSANVWDYENGFYWFADRRRFGKFLAHYELYKKILGMPGDILEFGVYKAASLIRMAVFRDLLETTYSRKIVGFDAFGDFPTEGLSLPTDRNFVPAFESEGGPGLDVEEVKAIFRGKGCGDNVRLIKGNVMETLPAFLNEQPQTRIALLHLDMDVYEPTQLAIELLWDRIVPGGVLVIDDYNAVEGATRAVDEFLATSGRQIAKLPISHVPAFIVK